MVCMCLSVSVCVSECVVCGVYVCVCERQCVSVCVVCVCGTCGVYVCEGVNVRCVCVCV